MDSLTDNTQGSSFPWKLILVGVIIAAVAGLITWLVMGKAKTRPLVQGFYAPPTVGAAVFPCAAMSSEAAAVYSMFASKNLSVGEEGPQDLHELRNLLAKLCCMKQDLQGVAATVSAVKELQFHTSQDIQPVADMTARCFAKTVPERDLDIQFGKWRDAGKDLIRRLCTASEMTESEHTQAETLFLNAWRDAYEVAKGGCLKGSVDGAFKTGPHEPAGNLPEKVGALREYDGLY